MMNSDSAHIPDMADRARQMHNVIDGQVRLIKCCLKATSTPSRCPKSNTNAAVCQAKTMVIVNPETIREVIQNEGGYISKLAMAATNIYDHVYKDWFLPWIVENS